MPVGSEIGEFRSGPTVPVCVPQQVPSLLLQALVSLSAEGDSENYCRVSDQGWHSAPGHRGQMKLA